MGAAAQASTVAEPNAAADAECVYAIMSESRARPRFSREDNGFDQSHTSKSCTWAAPPAATRASIASIIAERARGHIPI